MDFLKQPATFRIDEIDGVQKGDELDILWTAFATRSNQACIFKIQMFVKRPQGFPPMAFTTGKFIRVNDFPAPWDGSWFLRELMRVLEVSSFPKDVELSQELPFSAVILGVNLQRNSGGFSGEKRGNWMPVKIAVGVPSSEVYMHLNAEEGIGEFAIKDKDYGQTIINEFGKIILPKQDS